MPHDDMTDGFDDFPAAELAEMFDRKRAQS